MSVTTRRPREGEVGGIDYQFVSDDDFQRKLAGGELAESARHFDAAYGTPRAPVERAVREGRDILLDIDIAGARQMCDNYRADSVTIFVMPPSFAALEERLRKRNTETEEKIQKRLTRAREETLAWPEFDYLIVNREVAESLKLLEAIVDAERARAGRMREGVAPWKQ